MLGLDLLISLQCGSAFKKIHPLEDGVGSDFRRTSSMALQTPVSFQCLIVENMFI